MTSEPRTQDREPRLVLVTGKGGVGKSTVCAALAVAHAARGGRPLVVELGQRASMEGVFGVRDLDETPRAVGHGVHAMMLDFESAVLGYVASRVKVRAIARALVESRAMRGFFEAAPAVSEVATYDRLAKLLYARDKKTRAPRWDPVIVDLDATGHALMFLELPRVLDGLLGAAGPLRALIDRFSGVLSDPTMTELHLVTLPEDLPVRETLELAGRLREEHAIALGAIFVNQVPPVPIDAALVEARRSLLERALVGGDHDVLADLALLSREEGARARALSAMAPLDSLALPRVLLPRLDSDPSVEDLAALGALALGRTAEEGAAR